MEKKVENGMNQGNYLNTVYKTENRFIDKIVNLMQLMRVRQWSKNAFLFSGLLFTTSLNLSYLIKLLYAFLLFCGISSCVYIFNDIIDLKKDMVHPVKKFRPIASGKIKVKHALVFFYIVSPLTILLSFILNRFFGIIVAFYLIVNLAYSLKLKEFIFIDLLIISIGFVLRTLSGILIVDGEISVWFLLSVAFLTLFLGMNKRKKELLTLVDNSKNHRKNLSEYSIDLINEIIPMLTACTIIAYSAHVLYEIKIKIIFLTIPLVVYGVLRYQYLTRKEGYGESPELVLLKDKPIVLTILLWGVIYISGKLVSYGLILL